MAFFLKLSNVLLSSVVSKKKGNSPFRTVIWVIRAVFDLTVLGVGVGRCLGVDK
jgi:hypothetical protein